MGISGQYFYAPDSSTLRTIFTDVITSISTQLGGENQTKSGGVITTPTQVASNYNKTAVTKTLNLDNLSSAKLSFWHKFNIVAGANGGFLQIGYKDPGVDGVDDWDWKYLIPANAYTGNLRASTVVSDDFGQRIYWCWNGLSGSGQFTWDHVTVNLLDSVLEAYRDEVRIKFNYTQFGGGTGVGWYLDDVNVVVSRGDNSTIDATTKDIWNLENVNTTYGWAGANSGLHAWSNIDPVTGKMKPGIDNYLATTPIDLSSAKTAYLSAYFKFNMNYAGGSPPDGFRVEVSSDNGIGWTSINLGVRSAWGISGTEADAEDGEVDSKAYTGLTDSYYPGNPTYDASDDNYWVEAGSLSRLNLDLSSWSGNQILIRFRVVTNNLDPFIYPHDNNHNYAFPDPLDEFGGFFIDDVQVFGETIFG